jgi:hypothetical protein
MIRPGPPWIEHAAAPGGLVVYCFTATVPAVLLFRTELRPDDEGGIESAATRDGDFVRLLLGADQPVVLVVYDGDTGERLRPLRPTTVAQWLDGQ